MAQWQEVRIGTFNAQAASTDAEVIHYLHFAVQRCHYLALQEMGKHQKQLGNYKRNPRFVVNDLRIKTPVIIWKNRVRYRTIKKFNKLLMRRQNAGPGAGPNMVSAKTVALTSFRDKYVKRRINMGSTHFAASQYRRRRFLHAKEMLIKMTGWIRARRGLLFIGSDTNAVPSSRLWRFTNLQSTQDKFPVDTHSTGRGIDAILWRRSRNIRLKGVKTYNINPDDHALLIATFEIKVKKWARR